MAKKDIEEHIREAMSKPTEIDAEDLEPPVCAWCADELGAETEIVVWDIPERGNEDVVYRYRYCSEECKDNDRMSVLEGGDMHPHGEPERLSEDDRELLTDGGRVTDAKETQRCIVAYANENTHEIVRVTNGDSHYGTVGPSAETFREMLDERLDIGNTGPSKQMLVAAFMAACWEEGLNRGDIQNATATDWMPAEGGLLKTIIIGESEPSSISDFQPTSDPT